ncbi:hypothetical protein JZ751_007072 [Albula glossodonta]|uniref:Tetratricopeptide repeat protein 1 n=1 Tax=Albula glossodonta TaxID=121402 RepID=A0A8T2P2F6_9TELE|nr:hypothetical protein JZ751_007072 [Albula glossodonta]
MEEKTVPDDPSSLTLSKQHSGPDRGSDGHVAVSSDPPEQEEDSFFDCQETLEEVLGSYQEETAAENGTRSGEGERMIVNTERRDSLRDEEREGSNRGEEWEDLGAASAKRNGGGQTGEGLGTGESWTECKDEGESEPMEEKKDDCDFELKEEESPEFDEEYIRELEKDLSEEERESRKEESLRLKEIGNGQFKKGEHTEAEASYTEALGVCPLSYSRERSILFSNRAAARLHLDKKEKAIADCTKAIELNPNYIRAILRRAELYEKTDKLDEALEDYKAVVEKDPSIPHAREACMRLPKQIEERNEKLKEEMMGKLKDLGNMFLRPFGLSTSNFQVNQDPTSGSYSINFVQNPNNNNR